MEKEPVNPHDKTAPKAGRREWIGLAVLALPCLLYSMDLTVLHLAIPKLSAELEPTSAEFGGALGIAVFGSIGIAVYRGVMGDAVPAGVSPEAAEAAKSTLAGAALVARDLPGEVGRELASTAQAAFMDGLRLCAAISAVGALVLAVFAAVTLRHVRSSATDAPPAEPVPSPSA